MAGRFDNGSYERGYLREYLNTEFQGSVYERSVNNAGKVCARHKHFLLTRLPKTALDFVNEAETTIGIFSGYGEHVVLPTYVHMYLHAFTSPSNEQEISCTSSLARCRYCYSFCVYT